MAAALAAVGDHLLKLVGAALIHHVVGAEFPADLLQLRVIVLRQRVPGVDEQQKLRLLLRTLGRARLGLPRERELRCPHGLRFQIVPRLQRLHRRGAHGAGQPFPGLPAQPLLVGGKRQLDHHAQHQPQRDHDADEDRRFVRFSFCFRLAFCHMQSLKGIRSR